MEKEKFIDDFLSGTCSDSYKFFGCHKEKNAFVFRVYAPYAKSVRVLGDFNGWDKSAECMKMIYKGVWETKIKNAKIFDNYKYYIETSDGEFLFKTDPYAFHTCTRPETAGKVYENGSFLWSDADFLKKKRKKDALSSPINIYEIHLGSFKRHHSGSFLSYPDIARECVKYAKEMGYTHIELMPITEHPYDLSWGYQTTGYFAPTSRFGTGEDFKKFVDICHSENIGVILDWAGAHFPKDAHGLARFDGSYLYEYSDPLKREHPDWDTLIFDYSKGSVVSFLISSLCFWQSVYHIDGFRIDAVASMLYLDYGKRDRQWRRNEYGSNYNLEAIEFLKRLNTSAFKNDPSVLMIAEESTAFPLVTKPVYDGGLGFNFKWNMGWMNDMLSYMSTDPYFRGGLHRNITFSLTYAFCENFILPLSHDEVVHGKRSLIEKMPGSYEEKFANLRVFYAYMMAHPGKKLSFMGNEFAHFAEWNPEKEIDWMLLDFDMHRKFKKFIKDLNHFYLSNPEFWEEDFDWKGFSWISHDDTKNSVIAFSRKDKGGNEIICVANFCPLEHKKYRIGITDKGTYKCVFSTDRASYGGSGARQRTYKTKDIKMHGLSQSLEISIPKMSVLYFKKETEERKNDKREKERVHSDASCRRTREQT